MDCWWLHDDDSEGQCKMIEVDLHEGCSCFLPRLNSMQPHRVSPHVKTPHAPSRAGGGNYRGIFKLGLMDKRSPFGSGQKVRRITRSNQHQRLDHSDVLLDINFHEFERVTS